MGVERDVGVGMERFVQVSEIVDGDVQLLSARCSALSEPTSGLTRPIKNRPYKPYFPPPACLRLQCGGDRRICAPSMAQSQQTITST